MRHWGLRHPLLAACLAQGLGILMIAIWWMVMKVPLPFISDNDLLGFAFLQGFLAASFAVLLGAAWWWFPMHLGFMPGAFWLHGLILPEWVWPAGLCVLVLFFGWTGRSRAPLYLTGRASYQALLSLLPAHPCRMIDLGCGDGALLRHLARARQDCSFVGMEQAPLLWVWAWIAARGLPNLTILRGNFWHHSLSGYDLAYAFLSPAPMERLWEKACREMSPGTRLISNRFPVPALTPQSEVVAALTHPIALYCYSVQSRVDDREGVSAVVVAEKGLT